MPAALTLITGGGRSGKSRHALQLAENFQGKKTFIATCPVLDDEMRCRIDRHRQERVGQGWITSEEPVQLHRAIARAGSGLVLVDCLTLWVNNLIYDAEKNGLELSEDDVTRHCVEVLQQLAIFSGVVLLVTNEVGLGIIPENALARRFVDLSGRCNQFFANAAGEVHFMVSGQVLKVK